MTNTKSLFDIYIFRSICSRARNICCPVILSFTFWKRNCLTFIQIVCLILSWAQIDWLWPNIFRGRPKASFPMSCVLPTSCCSKLTECLWIIIFIRSWAILCPIECFLITKWYWWLLLARNIRIVRTRSNNKKFIVPYWILSKLFIFDCNPSWMDIKFTIGC